MKIAELSLGISNEIIEERRRLQLNETILNELFQLCLEISWESEGKIETLKLIF